MARLSSPGGRRRYADEPQTFPALEALRQQALDLSRSTRAVLTVDAYRRDWQAFIEWCREYGLAALPAADETMAMFLSWCISAGGYRLTTTLRRLCAVRHEHRLHGLPDPVGPLTRTARQGARRVLRERPRRVAALSVDQLRAMARCLMDDGSSRALRDRAVLVLGFACGFRRSNLHLLHSTELEFVSAGLVVHERSSKTDQEGKGRDIPLFVGLHPETCPVRALQDWLTVRGDWAGPLFPAFHARSSSNFYRRPLGDHEAVTRILKRALRTIGVDPGRYSSHSLRAGCVTTAIENGASDFEVMRRTGHKTLEVMRKYIRPERLFPAQDPLRQAL
jgi:site-specific recombinase XerD